MVPRLAAATAIIAPTLVVIGGSVVATATRGADLQPAVGVAAVSGVATRTAIAVLVASVIGAGAVSVRAATRRRDTGALILSVAILIAALALLEFGMDAEPGASRVTARDLLVGAF